MAPYPLDTTPIAGRLEINIETATGLVSADAPVAHVEVGWDKDVDPHKIWAVDYPCSDFGEPVEGDRKGTFSWKTEGGEQV